MKLNYFSNFFLDSYIRTSITRMVFILMFFLHAITNAQVTVKATDAEAMEATPDNEVGVFTIDLGAVPLGIVTVNFTLAGTAVDGDDYKVGGGSILMTTQTADITIVPDDDILIEGNETVILRLDSTDNIAFPIAASPDDTATVVIADNDTETVFFNLLSLPFDNIATEEPTDEGTFRIELSAANTTLNDIIVFASFSGSATLTDDYLTRNIDIGMGAIRFAPGERAIDVNIIDIVDDNLIEGDEEVTLTITGTNSILYSVGVPNTATVIIEDNDTCPLITEAPVLNTDVSTIFCDTLSQDLNAYTNSVAPDGSVLTWSTSSSLLDTSLHISNTVVTLSGNYFGFFYDEANACAGPALEIELEILDTPTVETTNPMPECGASSFTLTATVSDGGTLNWYANEVGGIPIETGLTFVTPIISETTIYYVDASASVCTSERIPVTATVNIQPIAGTTMDAAACSLPGNGRITTLDLDNQLSADADIGVWSVTTDPSSGSVTINGDNIVDFSGLANGDYIFTYTTTTAIAPCTNTSVTLTVSVETCAMDTDMDGIIDEIENVIGTDPTSNDSDGDNILDAVEVGNDVMNPLDEDLDGIIDALDSNILDEDGDMVVDQLDPANMNPCIPDNTIGVCDTDNDGIPDGVEIMNGTDELDPCDPNLTPACMPDDIDLSIEKIANKESVNVGSSLTFTITVTNLTQDRIINVEITDLLQSPFEYVSHTTSIGNYNEVSGIWTIEEILAEEIFTLEIVVEIAEVILGTYTNEVTISNVFPNDGDLSNNTALVNIEVSDVNCGVLNNIFSPNQDGSNDFLTINCLQNYPDNSLEIYDRYGNKVFEANRYDNTWDGIGKNGVLPKGTYFYILNLGDGSEVKKDWLQIIR